MKKAKVGKLASITAVHDTVVLGPAGSGVGVVAHALADASGVKVIEVDQPSSILASKRGGKAARPIWAAADVSQDCPVLNEAAEIAKRHPQARFVLCRRDAVGFVASRLRRWPGMPFAEHALLWATAERAGAAAAATLGGQLLVLKQEILASDPTRVASALVNHGVLTADVAGKFVQAARAAKRLRSSLEPDPQSLPLSRMGWSVEDKRVFAEICGPMMGNRNDLSSPRAVARCAPLAIDDLLVEREGLLVENEHLNVRRNGVERIFSLTPSDVDTPHGIYLPTIDLAGRNRMRGRFHNVDPNGARVRLGIEVSGSITGLPLLVYTAVLDPGEKLQVDAVAASADEMASISLWAVQEDDGQGPARLEVHIFTFSAM